MYQDIEQYYTNKVQIVTFYMKIKPRFFIELWLIITFLDNIVRNISFRVLCSFWYWMNASSYSISRNFACKTWEILCWLKVKLKSFHSICCNFKYKAKFIKFWIFYKQNFTNPIFCNIHEVEMIHFQISIWIIGHIWGWIPR